MRPWLATDRINLGFCLNISFVVNYRGAFRSIVAIAIDLLTSEDRYFLWITAVPLPQRCLQSWQYSVSRMRGVTLALSGPPNLQPESDHRYLILLLFRQPITYAKLYVPSVRSVVLVQTQLQYIQSPWEILFFSASDHTSNSCSRRDVTRLSNKRSPYLFGVATANRTKVTTPNKYGAEIIARMSDWENPPFRPVGCDSDGKQRNQPRDCAMTWAFHVLKKICRIKIS